MKFKIKKKEIFLRRFLKSFLVTYFILIQFLFLYFYWQNLNLKKEVDLKDAIKNELDITGIQREIWKGYVLAENKKEYKNELRKRMRKLKGSTNYKERMEYEMIFIILPNLK